MGMGARGPESIEAAVNDKLFSFKFAKFQASNDIVFLSGLGIQVGGGAIGSTHFQSIHLSKKETQSYGLHANNASIGFFGVHWGTTAICHKACLLMTIELACKHNEVWDA